MKLVNPRGKKEITVNKNELLEIFLEDFSAKNSDFELTINLVGDNAQCLIRGRISSQQNFVKNWQITQKFRGKKQLGKINLHGVAQDESFLKIKAEGIIAPESTQADITISEKVLLFENGRGELLPILTVKTNQVKNAKHGASIAPVNDEDLLFLTSRGISLAEAKNLLKKGFLN